MKILDTSNLIALIGVLLGMISSTLGFVYWYAQEEKKKYGMERDLGHLKRNYQQLSYALDEMSKENDRRFDAIERHLVEIKSSSYANK